jgi:signal transduction histidine kinase/ActR/RegA family two-component response regulator
MRTALAATKKELRLTKAQLAAQVADLQRLHGLSMRLSSHVDLPSLLDEVLRAVCALQRAPAGLLLLRDAGVDRFEPAARFGLDTDQSARLARIAPVDACVARRDVVLVEDMRVDPAFSSTPVADMSEYRAVCCVPLRTRSGEMVGVIATYFPQPQLPSPRELQLVELYGGQASEFIENARHFRELRDASRLKDEFLATLSHEIRTPLNAVLGWTRLLRTAGHAVDDRSAHALEAIERNSRIQAQLVEDLLDISRIVTGKLRMSFVPVNLPSVIEAAIDTVRPAADNKHLVLDVTLAEGLGVFGDPDRLQQIAWNLLANAVRFTPPGGRVTVRLERSSESAVLTVSDTGAGISAHFLPHVFDRFRQDEGTTPPSQKGLGLGLAIVRHLVDAHGGSVSVASGGPGRGATFTVSLPLGSTDAAREPAAAAPADGTPDLGDLQILIVEDEADSRDLLAAAFAAFGATVTAVASGVEALAALNDRQFDAMVADIGMADMNGYALIRAVRMLADKNARHLPAIALTVYATSKEREDSIDAGFDRHVSKPIDPAQVAWMLARLVREGNSAAT